MRVAAIAFGIGVVGTTVGAWLFHPAAGWLMAGIWFLVIANSIRQVVEERAKDRTWIDKAKEEFRAEQEGR